MLMEKANMEMADRNDTLRRVLAKLDGHRPGEAAHAQRVAVYAVATAQRLGLDADELIRIKEAALLHDIGKLTIDGALLRKSDAFDADDRQAAQLHTILFVKAMPVPEWLDRLGPYIRHHHERFDGSGYPDGLHGNEIPLGARIIAVAEAFDTGFTGAGWAQPMPEESILKAIQLGAGNAYDPEVVKAFLDIQPLIQPVL